uniref:cilia- and flagella-associated protein 57-like n=1 Tax=Myxine glutinosa TaxID=7769 RepID=UPI00358F687E
CRQAIRLPEPSEAIVNITWSSNGTLLAVAEVGVDYQLFVWSWEQNKLLSLQRIVGTLPGPPLQLSVSHEDEKNHVSLTGPGGLHLYRLPEPGKGLQEVSLPSCLEPSQITVFSHTWLDNHRIAVATERKEILIFDASAVDCIQLEASIVLPQSTSSPSSSSLSTPPETKHFFWPLVAYDGGLAYLISSETVVLFQPNDGATGYKQIGLVQVPPGPLQDSKGKNKSQVVVSMCVSLHGDSLVIATDQKQLYFLHLTPQRGEIRLEPMAIGGHTGPVSGLAVCAKRPIAASCSLDGSIRVWNYETRQLETLAVFAEKCLCLALHPNALFFAAGFLDNVQYFSLLMSGPRCTRQLPIHACLQVVFSHGGNLLAAASSNVVHVFSCVTFHCLIRLHGHNGKVSGLDWRNDDQCLGSVSLDGTAYLWNLWEKAEDGAGRQESKAKLQGYSFHDLSVESNGTHYAAGEIAREAANVHSDTTPVLQPDGVIVEVADSQICVTLDQRYLLTASEDSCLLLWHLEGRPFAAKALSIDDTECNVTDEVLVSRMNLLENEQTVVDLHTRLDEVHSAHECQMRLHDTGHEQQKQEMIENLLHEKEKLDKQYQILKSFQVWPLAGPLNDFDVLVLKPFQCCFGCMLGVIVLLERKSLPQSMFLMEHSRTQEVKSELAHARESGTSQLAEAEEEDQREIAAVKQHFQDKLQQNIIQHTKESEVLQQRLQEQEEMARQDEEDSDMEILEIKSKLESQLKTMGEQGVQLSNETGLMRNKYVKMQGNTDEHAFKNERLCVKVGRLQGRIVTQERNVATLQGDVMNIADTVQHKEKHIYDLGKSNQQLEKFNYILDYEICELQKKVKPYEIKLQQLQEEREQDLSQSFG